MSRCRNHDLFFCALRLKCTKTLSFSPVVVAFCLWITQHTRLHLATARIVLPALMTSLRFKIKKRRKKKSMVLHLCRKPTPFNRHTYGSTCVRESEVGGEMGLCNLLSSWVCVLMRRSKETLNSTVIFRRKWLKWSDWSSSADLPGGQIFVPALQKGLSRSVQLGTPCTHPSTCSSLRPDLPR